MKRSKPPTKQWIANVIQIDPNTQCWNWIRFRDVKGYGKVSYRNRPTLAHRLVWILYYGPIPPTMFVCHHCDNPGCVNPEHLFIGTAKDNSMDMMRKGRWKESGVRGEIHGMSKLTSKQIQDIANTAGKQRDIAKLFGISQCHVWRIKHRHSWKHLKY